MMKISAEATGDFGADTIAEMIARSEARSARKAKRELANSGCTDTYVTPADIFADHLTRQQAIFIIAMREEYAKNAKAIRRFITRASIRSKTKMNYRTLTAMKAFMDSEDGSAEDASPFDLFLDFGKSIAAISDRPHKEVQDAADYIQSNKIIHANQIRTMVDILFQILLNPRKSVAVIGAVQSGKTGIGLSLIMFAAPIIYRLTGIKIRPIFISTNQNSHVSQTKDAFKRNLMLYGAGRIVYSAKDAVEEADDMTVADYFATVLRSDNTDAEPENPAYSSAPTIRNYCEVVLGAADAEEIIDGYVFIRSPGKKGVQAIRAAMNAADERGETLMMIADEPQYGASGNDAETSEDGRMTGCVMKQILKDYEEALTPKSRHLFVGLSATPFEIADLDDFIVVWAKLPSNYVGYNCFARGGKGRKIDPEVHAAMTAAGLRTTPRIVSFDKIEGIDNASLLQTLFCISIKTKRQFGLEHAVSEMGFTPETARERAGEILVEIYNQCAAAEGSTMPSACLRVINDNTRTKKVIDDAKLANFFNILNFSAKDYHVNNKAVSVSEAIKMERKKATYDASKPLLILVTAKARMGDDFPAEVEQFYDMVECPSDMNAALQGLAGRAAGAGKFKSTVFVSEDYAELINDYVESDGEETGLKTSRHSSRVDLHKRPRGRGPKIGRIGYYESGDLDWVKALLADLTAEVRKSYPGMVETMRADKVGEASNYVDLPRILEKHNVWNRLSDESTRRLIDPVWDYNFVKPDQSLTRKIIDEAGAEVDQELVWPLDESGKCYVQIRHISVAQAAAEGTTRLSADRMSVDSRNARIESKRNDGNATANGLNIQLSVRKVDANGNEVVDIKRKGHTTIRAKGFLVVDAIAIPLHHEAQAYRMATRKGKGGSFVLPVTTAAYDSGLRPNGTKRNLRDGQLKTSAQFIIAGRARSKAAALTARKAV